MNYRHVYHAGNFADIFKHLMMVLAVDYLHLKDKGLLFLDAFAGCGLYDLTRDEAKRTGEFTAGIARLMAAPATNPDLRRYQDLVAAYWTRTTYPGSPLLLAELMRPQDRLVANELHPEDHATLDFTLGRFSNTRVTKQDAYEAIRANIPPAERRGLILIDPPFEKKNEFDLLVQQMLEWKKRWPTGCYMLWYPIKAHLPIDEFYELATELDMGRTWAAEFLLHPRAQPETFNGCGLLLFNAPFSLAEKISTLAPELCSLLGGRIDMKYLRDD